MPRRTSPIARIPLAGSRLAIMAGPVVVAAAGVAALVAAIVAGGFAALGLMTAAALLIAFAIFGAAALVSVRLEVHESHMRLSWLGGERVYPLAKGSVTRVALQGPRSSSLRPGLGALGWAFGPARLRGTERIEVIRLKRTRTVIIVPTERGRLAVAPASEEHLLAALSRAARARQRMEALQRRAEMTAPAVEEPPAAFEPMTGIERAVFERGQGTPAATAVAPARIATPPVSAEREERPITAPAPALEARATTTVAPVRGRLRTGRPRRWLARLVPPRPGIRAAFILLPAALSAGTWVVLDSRGMVPAAPAESRLLVTALVLAGPAALLGGMMARAWWARLVPVVVLVGLASLVIVARAMLGGAD